MNRDHPLHVIADLPHLLECEPQEQLLLAGIDRDGSIIRRDHFPLTTLRPLDDAAITITRWPADVIDVTAVAYSDSTTLNPVVVRQAISASGRNVAHLLRAGTARWRSYTCSKPRCCPAIGNRYSEHALGHEPFVALDDLGARPIEWRRRMWDAWRITISGAESGREPDLEMQARLAASLHDVPLRDALLAQSARVNGTTRTAILDVLILLARHSPLGINLPVHTCTAALLYLENLTEETAAIITAVLSIDEYSLARLLNNGLQMRAPASLLARSFAHFDPMELLAA